MTNKIDVEIVPTILAKTKREFDEKFAKLIKMDNPIHIDFIDNNFINGKFINAKSIKLSDVPSLKNYKNKFEAHLMVMHPETWIKRLENKGFKKVIFHYNTLEDKDIPKLANDIRKLDMEAFIAINPETRETKIFPYLKYLDGVLVMGVNPGKEGQTLLKKTYYRLQCLRAENHKVKLQVDGGINLYTATEVIKSGASIINSGTFITGKDNPKEALRELSRHIRGLEVR